MHTIEDTQGVLVCFGTVDDPTLLEEAKYALKEMGAKWSEQIEIVSYARRRLLYQLKEKHTEGEVQRQPSTHKKSSTLHSQRQTEFKLSVHITISFHSS